MIDAQGLMRTHVETLFTLDSNERLRTVNAPEGGLVPRVVVGQTAAGTQCWFRHDVGRELALALEALCAEGSGVDDVTEPILRSEPYEAVLRTAGEVEQVWTGPTYRFPDQIAGGSRAEFIQEEQRGLLDPYLAEWMNDVAECQPLAVMRAKGRAVSLCGTVRRSGSAEEAGVETHRDFRGRGLAGEALAAWSRAVRESGREPLYSTSWTNHPSVA